MLRREIPQQSPMLPPMLLTTSVRVTVAERVILRVVSFALPTEIFRVEPYMASVSLLSAIAMLWNRSRCKI